MEDIDYILEHVTQYADQAHGKQTRKYSEERYIVHPLRVMEMIRPHTNDVSILAAALLHDVLEDTQVTEEQLKVFLNSIMPQEQASKALHLVQDLTDVYTHQAFPDWNRDKRKAAEINRLSKIRKNAQTIKYADIIDNAKDITANDKGFANKFLKESRTLLTNMREGDKAMYKEAVQTVRACLEQLHPSQKNH